MENVTHHVKVLGKLGLEPEFEVKSEEEFQKIITSLKG